MKPQRQNKTGLPGLGTFVERCEEVGGSGVHLPGVEVELALEDGVEGGTWREGVGEDLERGGGGGGEEGG